MIGGYFLPWTPHTKMIGGSVGMSKERVTRRIRDKQDTEDSKAQHTAVNRLVAGQTLSGSQWMSLFDAMEGDKTLNEAQQRVFTTTKASLLVLPIGTGVLLVLMLLLTVPAKRAMQAGAGPVAAILAVAKAKPVAGLIFAVSMAIGLVVAAFAVLLWVGLNKADISEEVGLGLKLIAGGAALSFFSSFLGYGPGRIGALVFALVLIAATVGGLWWYIGGAEGRVIEEAMVLHARILPTIALA